MKRILKLYGLPLFFFANLFLSFSASGEEQVASDKQLKSLPEITVIAASAIDAAKHSVEVMQDIISMMSIFIGAIIAAVGILGIKSWHVAKTELSKAVEEAKKNVAATAENLTKELRDKVEALKIEANESVSSIKNIKEEAEATRKQLKIQTEELQADITTHHQITMEGAKSMTHITNAMRLWGMAELLSQSPSTEETDKKTREDYIKGASFSLSELISSSNKSGNVFLTTWAHSMLAYIQKAQGELDVAIFNAEEAINVIKKAVDLIRKKQRNESMSGENRASDDARMIGKLEEALPLKYYNLACYYCLRDLKDKWMPNLELAISGDSQYKYKARTDKDFKKVWQNDVDFQRLTS